MEEKAQSSRVYDAREMAWSVTLKAKCEAKDKRKMSHPQSDKKKVMVMQSTSEDYPPPMRDTANLHNMETKSNRWTKRYVD
jgi:hypothetical protein